MRKRFRIVQVLFGFAFCFLGARAECATVREFQLSSPAVRVTAGSDGGIWFTQTGIQGVVRMAPDGSYEVVPLAASPQGFWDIAPGSGGSFWITSPFTNEIVHLFSNGHAVRYPLPPQTGADTVTIGPDGNVWFHTVEAVGRLRPTGEVALFPAPGGTGPIVTGTDGNLWFSQDEASRVGRLTAAGQLTEFPLAFQSFPNGIASGVGGDLWVTESQANRIGRISVAGIMAEYDLPRPNSHPLAIVQGPDGGMWYTASTYNEFAVFTGWIARITGGGVVSDFELPTAFPGALTVGPDGNLWFTLGGSKIGRFTIGGTSGPCVAGDAMLCIDDGPGDRRFKVEVEYSTTQGTGYSGTAHAISVASLGIKQGGLFWFFSQDNPELLVKVLDGCAVNGHRWVFIAGGTNVALVITVSDTVSGEVHTYYNHDLTPFAPLQDVRVLACGG